MSEEPTVVMEIKATCGRCHKEFTFAGPKELIALALMRHQESDCEWP